MQHILKRKAKNVILYITSRLFSTAKSTVSFGEKTASDVENHVSRFVFLLLQRFGNPQYNTRNWIGN